MKYQVVKCALCSLHFLFHNVMMQFNIVHKFMWHQCLRRIGGSHSIPELTHDNMIIICLAIYKEFQHSLTHFTLVMGCTTYNSFYPRKHIRCFTDLHLHLWGTKTQRQELISLGIYVWLVSGPKVINDKTQALSVVHYDLSSLACTPKCRKINIVLSGQTRTQ